MPYKGNHKLRVPVPWNSWTKEKLAWAAGIIDGEGCTCSPSHSGRTSRFPEIILQVGQASKSGEVPQMLLRMHELFGGTITSRNGRKQGHQTVFQWTLNGHERVQAAIASVWPWLGDVKREQAKDKLEVWRVSRCLTRLQVQIQSGMS